MESLLAVKYRRRVLLSTAIITSIFLISIRFFILPLLGGIPITSPIEILKALSDNFLVAIVASVSITYMSIWLTPPVMEHAVMEIVDPLKIREVIQLAPEKTYEWWSKGHTGRYFRAKILPKLAADARSENVTKKVKLLLLDPTNIEICQRYATYRQNLRTATKGRPWTLEAVRNEIYATIITVYLWKEKQSSLDIDVVVLNNFSIFRIDLSSRLVLITTEDPIEPGVKCDAGTFFYKSYNEDLILSFKQGKLLPDVTVPNLETLDVNTICELFKSLDLDSPTLTTPMLEEIIAITKKAEDPYA